jgi:hypothetical protein
LAILASIWQASSTTGLERERPPGIPSGLFFIPTET